MGKGPQPTQVRLAEGEPAAQTVVQPALAVRPGIAQSLPTSQWSRHLIKEGSQGPLIADFAALRIVTVRDGLPGPEVWSKMPDRALVLRPVPGHRTGRNIESGELKTYLSNAPADTPLLTLVRLSGMRWPIETGFEDGKQSVIMETLPNG